jgi:hypothetical protein
VPPYPCVKLISVGPVFEEVDEIGNKPNETEDDTCEKGGGQPAKVDMRLKKIPRHPEHTNDREQ